MSDTPASNLDLIAENTALRAELAHYKAVAEHAEHELQLVNARIAEEAARADEREQSLRLLRHALDSSPSATYIKDREGRFLLVNQRAAALMGMTPEQLIGRADHELFPAEFVAQWRAAERDVIATRATVEQEETAPQPDGIHTFLSSRAPILDAQGVVCAISGVSTDISARIRAEDALRANQTLLTKIIDYLPVGVMLKQASDGRFILWNSTAEAIFGAKAVDVVGKTDHELFPKAIADGLWAKHQAVVASGKPDVVPAETIRSPERGPVEAQITRVPLFDGQGRPAYMLIITTDLSEQKRAADERAALQAQVIEAQQHALRELSTPLLPLSGRVVLMPIIGAMDSGRAQQVIETLLQGVAQHNAELAIVDITGVQVVDTQVANAFIQSARAVQLLGARVMLTGIRPEVAQTLVQLGIDLQGLLTRGSLQAGIAYAFNR